MFFFKFNYEDSFIYDHGRTLTINEDSMDVTKPSEEGQRGAAAPALRKSKILLAICSRLDPLTPCFHDNLDNDHDPTTVSRRSDHRSTPTKRLNSGGHTSKSIFWLF